MSRLGIVCSVVSSLSFLASGALALVTTERVASGLRYPVYCTAPEGDSERLFILEQRGVIRILKNGVLLPDPFLDIESRVSFGYELAIQRANCRRET